MELIPAAIGPFTVMRNQRIRTQLDTAPNCARIPGRNDFIFIPEPDQSLFRGQIERIVASLKERLRTGRRDAAYERRTEKQIPTTDCSHFLSVPF